MGRGSTAALSLFLAGLLIAIRTDHVPAQGIPSQTASETSQQQERIHLGDLIDVDVIGSLEFDWRGGLTPQGYLDGLERAAVRVNALCRTEAEVAADVTEQYRHQLRDPKVVVRILDRSNRALAYVTGAVRKPQRYQLRRSPRLAELITLSGGIIDTSNGEVSIFRPPNANCEVQRESESTNSKPRRLTIKLADLLAGQASANPFILSGDIVTVEEAAPVFVTGDVAAPRRLNLTPDLTLSRAIASAGGLSNRKSGEKVRIHRRDPVLPVIEVDLSKIRESPDADVHLLAFDVVEVGRPGALPRKNIRGADPAEAGISAMTKYPLRIVD